MNLDSTIKVAVVGASGYAGLQLCRLVKKHPRLTLSGAFVSEHSLDLHKKVSDIDGSLKGICDEELLSLSNPKDLWGNADAVFLATDHKVSHDVAGVLVEGKIAVFDLSGAFRIHDLNVFSKAYGFEHEYPDLIKSSVYALCEYTDPEELKKTSLISLPGCYPTASQLALKPLVENNLLDLDYRPSINAVSGVSGAGRKAKLGNSFCEVSLNAYGVFSHRHQPEIEEHLGIKVIFTPHLGSFKRGIHATITARLKDGIGRDEVALAYKIYEHKPLVRVLDTLPHLSYVQYTPFCDIGYAIADNYIIIVSCIDNLLKGAAAQAMQALNLHYGMDETLSLL